LHSFSAETPQQHLSYNINVFFFFFIHSLTKSTLQYVANVFSTFTCFAAGVG